MNRTIACLPVEALAPILGVPKIVENFLTSEALATRPTDARILYRIAQSVDPSCILEIGTFYGHTTVGLARNCPTATIYTVDICEEMKIPVPRSQNIELLPRSQVGQCFWGQDLKIVQRFGDSRERSTYSEIPKIDLAYIDGNHCHEAILKDSENVLAACRHGGIIVWHDYKDDPSVETIAALHDLVARTGFSVYHIAGTWLAFMVVE